MASQRHTILPIKTNLSARAITNAVWAASDAFGVGDYSQMTVEVVHDNSSCADIQFFLEHSPDGTNWSREEVVTVAAGTGTLVDYTYLHAVAADDAWHVQIPLTMDGNYRLQFTGTTGDGVDTVTVYVHLSM
ncbi:MAG TPA: hypothetical protein VM537_19695 [Anaerolineae bacterium]|nr:hypothetical protein [Anaerolineae bacterium]